MGCVTCQKICSPNPAAGKTEHGPHTHSHVSFVSLNRESPELHGALHPPSQLCLCALLLGAEGLWYFGKHLQ